MSHGTAHAFAPPSATPPKPDILRGWIKTTRDAMLVFEATRVGIVPRVTRRFHELEKRSIIRSGAIFVFTEEESGIKRWTDPYLWSASRMQGNFLMYRERDDHHDPRTGSPYHCSAVGPSTELAELLDPELEHYILGSWNKGKGLKQNGLMKKTISISIEGTVYHLISYYYPSDVRSGLLQTPSSMSHLASLEISPAVLRSFSQARHSPAQGKPKRGRPPRSRIIELERPTGLLLSIPSTPAPSPGEMTPNNEWYSPVTPNESFAPASCPAPRSLPLVSHSETHPYARPSSSPPSEAHPYRHCYYPHLNIPASSSSSMVYASAQAEPPWSHTSSSSGPLPSYSFPVYDYDYDFAAMPPLQGSGSSTSASAPTHTASPSAQYPVPHYMRYPQDIIGIPAAQAYYPGPV
ncbi:hypothetical protein K466DRAFT_234386 [Polyporus arcularius HHB13444]|uniref:Gti1/Pac2 family-domain-containing protein n=1 Tax=Polyporus arcularius HHB13444 TaxID=1314778 RepID=A0A5C3P7G0_9APHY|nr:hypothetical protein K466DRAFT_234386 [Polyporus arcularius HHB13444]